MTDLVNHPPHYRQGRVEAIDIIEDAVGAASDPVAGYLQGQVLKYLLRLWHKDKDNPAQDAQKACWYLMRLVDHLAAETHEIQSEAPHAE